MIRITMNDSRGVGKTGQTSAERGGKEMDYKGFKEKLLEGLRRSYGDRAEVELTDVQKNNGVRYDGIRIRVKGDRSRVAPVIRVEEVYSRFAGGGMDMEGCVQAVSEMLKDNSVPKNVEQIAEKVNDWEYVKENVFPILLSTENNRELLQGLASTQMLDLSVVYIIRFRMAGDFEGNAKINRNMLEIYGISTGQLHEQAMENLRRDGYEFQSMESIIRSMIGPEGAEEMHRSTGQEVMYVLTNSSRTYGAAGILDKELLKEFAGEQDYYIIPSSVHETIFVPVTDDGIGKKDLDNMVAEVNAAQVSVEERLTDHCYYYDAGTGKIRMCA